MYFSEVIDKVSHVSQDGFELLILLPSLAKSLDYSIYHHTQLHCILMYINYTK